MAWFVALVAFFPFFYLVLSGFKTEAEAPKMPPTFFPVPADVKGIPLTFNITWDNYVDVVVGSSAGQPGAPPLRFMPYLINSAAAVGLSTLAVLLLATPAAWALTWRRTTHKRDVLFFLISTKFLPSVGVIVPIFVIARNVGMLDNQLTLIIMYTAMNLPIAVWMLRSFFVDLPADVLDAARVDGAGTLQELFWIALPLVRSGLVATVFLCIVFSWNEFFLAVTLTATKAATVPMYMIGFQSALGPYFAQLAAAGTIAALPVVIIGWIGQHHLVRGLSMGAVK